MPGRTIAIGDIHGCSEALAGLIEAIEPSPVDQIVTLGDYVDRGTNSRGVLDQLIALEQRCRLFPLMGDHEEMLLAALRDSSCRERWLRCGGIETLKSYGWAKSSARRSLASWIPQRHLAFLSGCRLFHETSTHIFLHAGFLPDLPMDQQPSQALLWRVTDAQSAVRHCSGKVAVVGHTPQLSGEVLDLEFLVCIDTNCARGGWLTALDTSTGQRWQVDRTGKERSTVRK
jgi:serine/threonine protein phosphatase 1